MVDMLPFPRISGDTPEKQISELTSYLIQFKETLEFALMNISTENLSADLINKLNDLGANIQASNESREEELAQISVNTLTISDVCESNAFKEAIKKEVSGNIISLNINFETGHLEYTMSE